MSDSPSPIESLQSRYAEKLAADLRRNAQDHQRVTTQIAELQQQLSVLQEDREMLLNLQSAISAQDRPLASSSPAEAPAGAIAPVGDSASDSAAPADPAVEAAAFAEEPSTAPRRGKAAKKAARKAATSRRGKAGSRKREGRGTGKDGDGTEKAPRLVDLVAGFLRKQNEPTSAAEVATGVSTPDRPVGHNQARAALEGLVSRSAVTRSRQGNSVYYEAAAPAGQTAPAPPRATPAGAAGQEPGGDAEEAPARPQPQPLSAEQVLAALQELGGAQTVRGIAEHVFTESPDNATTNRVRTTLTRLVDKGLATKGAEDGKVVFAAKAS